MATTSQNVYQLIDLQYIDPSKKSLKIRKIEFVKIYKLFSEDQAKAQTDRCLSCDNPYCEWEYPVYNYVPNWLRLASEGRISETTKLSHQTNALPGVCGRVCPWDYLCGGPCTLDNEFGAVTIGNIERYINDKALEMDWRSDTSGVKQTGRKVTIIGTDPTGLACTDVLTYNDVGAVVFNRHPEIGDLLTLSIPAFRLEKEVVTRHHGTFTGMDIGFRPNTEVGHDVQLGDLLSDYDTAFLGVKTYQLMHDRLGSEDANGAYVALPFLITSTKRLVGFDEARDRPFASMESRRVVVLSSGDTAADRARTFVRQGMKYVTYAYRRDEENMSGSCREAKNVQEEGIGFEFNTQPLGIEVNGSGKVNGVKVACTEMGEPGAKGHRRAEIVASSERIVPADAVIMAFGFRPHNME